MKKLLFLILLFIAASNLYAEDEINRHNVPDEMANPKRVKADDIFYAKIGYGGVLGKIHGQGTSVGFGYRHEMDDMAVDFGFFNFIIPKSKDNNDTFSCNWVQIQALYFFSPVDNRSFYAGGGLAYNNIAAERKDIYDDLYTTHGIAGVATFGYEIMRTSTVRCFVQLEATLPFARMKADHRDPYYGSTVNLSMGIGF